MARIVYFNIKTQYGIETLDEIDRGDFKTYKEFRTEIGRLKNEYRLASDSYAGIYTSQRCTNDWKEKETFAKVEDIKKGELVKRTPTAKKLYYRGDYYRESKRYGLTDYDDMNHELYVKKGTILYTDWVTNESDV